MPKPFVLMILDGWGHRPEAKDNAITTANTPSWDYLWQTYPHTLIQGSGTYVGLPDGQMGNSEVGHLNIGAGRLVYQDFTRIENAIADGTFAQNPAFISAIEQAVRADKAVHVMGLLSPGGVHSHQKHLFAMLQTAANLGAKKLFLHGFTDGRDTPPKSAKASIEAAEQVFKTIGHGCIASLSGRYYAMDRDNRWDRVEAAYFALTQGQTPHHHETALSALEAAYAREELDEFLYPTVIHPQNAPPVTMAEGDVIIFMNYRADRARELSRCFTEADFSGFDRGPQLPLADFVTLTQYASDIQSRVAFPPTNLKNTLGETLANLGLRQLRAAETEKYAHVTFFFNGGVETPFPGEERLLIPSPDVKTYDLQPEMSAPELTEKLIAAIYDQQHEVIICNFANPDMVGHTGNFAATVKAIEALDTCLQKIHHALLQTGGECLITADHGNAEKMLDSQTGQAHTAHTNEPVPLIYCGRPARFVEETGCLSDIAPTLLRLIDQPIPEEMTGRVLLELS